MDCRRVWRRSLSPKELEAPVMSIKIHRYDDDHHAKCVDTANRLDRFAVIDIDRRYCSQLPV